MAQSAVKMTAARMPNVPNTSSTLFTWPAVIIETTIAQLKRFKDDAREVAEGFECGILLDGFNDVKEGDIIEAFETREIERTTLDQPPAATASTS